MQPQTNKDCTQYARRAIGLVATSAIGVGAIAPQYAYGLSLGEAVREIGSSPTMCFVIGVGAGAAVTFVASSCVYRGAIRDLKQRMNLLEEQQDAVDRTEESPVVTQEHVAQPPQETGSVSDDTVAMDMPVIERGTTGYMGATSPLYLDQMHNSQVHRHLSASVRARMIDRRIPKLDEVHVESEFDPFADPANFDSTSYVERMFSEEMERASSKDVYVSSRSRLTVIEGNGESSTPTRLVTPKMRNQRQHGKHFAPISKEA